MAASLLNVCASKSVQFFLCVQLFKSNAVLTDYLYGREVVDVVDEFRDAVRHVSCADFVGQLKTLQPRYYSISSSPLLVHTSAKTSWRKMYTLRGGHNHKCTF